MNRFDRDTSIKRIDATTFEGHVDRGWWISRGPNGGYIAAILLRALAETVDDSERAPRSFTVHFTSPPQEGPIQLQTQVERTGRSLTTVSGRMWQGGRLCALGLAAFSKGRSAPEFQDVRMPIVPPPEQTESHSTVGSHSGSIGGRYERRSVARALSAAPERGALAGGWTRLSEPRPADALLVAALTDCWPPAVRERLGSADALKSAGAPTVELTVHFRAELPLADAKPDDFTLTLFRTRIAREGFLDEEGEIWSRGGILLAQSRQLGVLLV
jgi:acyl-CoA thioesterase